MGSVIKVLQQKKEKGVRGLGIMVIIMVILIVIILILILMIMIIIKKRIIKIKMMIIDH